MHYPYRKSIDLDSYKPKRGSKRRTVPQFWLPGHDLQLLTSDRDILLSPTEWLTDTIINASQQLLQRQFPNLSGLQDVSLGLTMNFDIQTGEFIQILHTTDSHWLTVTTVGLEHPNIHIFDSVYLSVPTMAKAQIASLLFTKLDTINVHIMKVQKQVRLYQKFLDPGPCMYIVSQLGQAFLQKGTVHTLADRHAHQPMV